MGVKSISHMRFIGGFSTVNMDNLATSYPALVKPCGRIDWEMFETLIKLNNYVYFVPSSKTLAFTLAEPEDPKGCKINTVISAAIALIEQEEPSRKNSLAITKLQEALHWLEH